MLAVPTRMRRRTVTVLAGPPAVAFVLLTLAVAGRSAPLMSFDARVSAHAYTTAIGHPAWRAVMQAVTVTGGLTVLGPLTVMGCAALMLAGRRREAAFAAAAMTITPIARLAALAAVARPRPMDQLTVAANYSYPSGHSTAAATAALVLVLLSRSLLRTRHSRAVLAAVAGTWAVLVGVSRVALVVHWPSDVAGAWLFSTVMVLLTGYVTGLGRRSDMDSVTDRT